MSTAIILTHTSPSRPGEPCARCVAAAERAGWRLVADQEELTKHGEAAAGIGAAGATTTTWTSAWSSAATGRSSRACASTGSRDVPVFGINFGTVGFLAAAEPDELDAEPRAAPSPATTR